MYVLLNLNTILSLPLHVLLVSLIAPLKTLSLLFLEMVSPNPTVRVVSHDSMTGTNITILSKSENRSDLSRNTQERD